LFRIWKRCASTRAKQNWGIEGDEALLASKEVKDLLRHEIDALSDDLADFRKDSRHSDRAAAVLGGKRRMTPTLKIKRNVVAEKYAASAEA
jgi:hypothetical protein